MSDTTFLKRMLILVFTLWAGVSTVAYYFLGDWAVRGQFGDLFGAVNSLFSGLGFAGLLYTIVLQQKQLSMQREELAMQREEMRASRGELANQTRAQTAMFKATVAQISITALQAQMEAIKIQLPTASEGVRKNHQYAKLQQQADNILKIAQALDANELAASLHPSDDTPGDADEQTSEPS